VAPGRATHAASAWAHLTGLSERLSEPLRFATMATTGGEPLDAPTPELAIDLDELVDRAREAIARAQSTDELRQLAADLLGRRSLLARARERIGSLPAEQRPVAGRAVDRARRALEETIAARRSVLERTEREARMTAERVDLTEVTDEVHLGRIHLVERTRQELEDIFVGLGFAVVEGPEVETDWYNFEALNIGPWHPARGMFDTFYLDLEPAEAFLLRTHTSPVQVRLLETRPLPIAAVVPGRCYRRDTPDARHLPAFHQIEGLVVDGEASFAELAGTIEAFTRAYFGSEVATRFRPAYFPFTEPSAEFEITCAICKGSGCRTCSGSGWVELGGCGMVHPRVFEAAGVDPAMAQGFAFGFGIDRCAAMRHGVADVRAFVENDVRFLRSV
jgi:phenylalanyl-tRNA synthetase alpha chain